LSRFKLLKGFRHILQSEADDEFMLRTDFVRGISTLQKYGLTYDILIYPKHLKYAKQLVKAFSNQPFVIDHLAKPYIRDKNIDQWRKDIQALAEHENVWCKVSGMVTEANWKDWKSEDFNPYLDTVFESFGPNRILFGSDWPVCQLAASYGQVVDIVRQYTASFSPDEQVAVWEAMQKLSIIFFKSLAWT
jgi:L-fuconolactonase